MIATDRKAFELYRPLTSPELNLSLTWSLLQDAVVLGVSLACRALQVTRIFIQFLPVLPQGIKHLWFLVREAEQSRHAAGLDYRW